MVGQHVQAKVVEIDLDNQKIGLSIRELLKKEEPAEEVVEEIPTACPELDMTAPEQELVPEEVPAEIPALEVEPAVKAVQVEEEEIPVETPAEEE